MSRGLTLVVHGTFAAGAGWWRRGGGSFADRLDRELAERGLPGTVWQPALDAGMSHDDFAWSGRNSHADRIAGAKKLAAGLERLAEALGCTAENPLPLRMVAHSHGGNVALETIGRLSERVAPERLVLLGTPLLRSMPAWRTGRLALASLLAGLVLLGASVALAALLSLAVLAIVPELRSWVTTALLVLFFSVTVPFLAGVLIGLAAVILDAAWWFVAYPFWALRGRARLQAYGPSPKKLLARLCGAPVLCFESPIDEAGLGLAVCGAPLELLARKLPASLRGGMFEDVFLGRLVELPEVIAERLAFGYSWWRLLISDVSVSEESDWSHPASVFQRIDVTDDLEPAPAGLSEQAEEVGAERAGLSGTRREAARIDAELGRIQRELEVIRRGIGPWDLDRRLGTVAAHLESEIVLKHSRYYESHRIVERVAEALAT